MAHRMIRAEVDPRALTLAGKLFEGGIETVLRELAQNARRAGARQVAVTWDPGPEAVAGGLGLTPRQSLVAVTFRDDGCGCASPEVALRLGGVGWGPEAADEQPAGMGLSALAGMHGVRMHSRRAGEPGWTLSLDRTAFTGEREVEVEPLDAEAAARIGPHGTEVSLLTSGWTSTLEVGRRAAAVMASTGIPWTGNGAAMGAGTSLEGWADAVYVHGGIAYGVREMDARDHGPERRAWPNGDTNVYGVQIHLGLHSVQEADGTLGHGGRVLHVCAEVRSGAPLPLTLPQRDRVADEGAAAAVREQALCTVLRHAEQRKPRLRVDGRTHTAARRRGITLAEAANVLQPWSPLADAWDPPSTVQPGAVRLGRREPGPEERILLAQALEDVDDEERLEIFEDEPSMAGLQWYEAMRSIVRVEAVAGGSVEWKGEAWRVQGLRCRVVMDDESTWERAVGLALEDPTDGGMDLTAEEVGSWVCKLDADALPHIADMERWITSVFDEEKWGRGDGAAAAEEFAQSTHEAVLAWMGVDRETQIRERISEVATAALAKHGPAEAAHRSATIHWIPGDPAVVGLSPKGEEAQKAPTQGDPAVADLPPEGEEAQETPTQGEPAVAGLPPGGEETQETPTEEDPAVAGLSPKGEEAQEAPTQGDPERAQIERKMRCADARTLAEEAAHEGIRLEVRRAGTKIRQAIGGGRPIADELEDTTLELDPGTADGERAQALAWLAGTALARWWCRRRAPAEARQIVALDVLTLPVAEGLVERIMEQAGAEGGNDAQEEALLAEAYGLDADERRSIWG